MSHRRTHSLLLLQKLLNAKAAASPFTLLLDSIEQTARPLTREFIARAKANKVTVIFLAFEALKKPPGVDVFVKGRGKDLNALSKEVTNSISKDQSSLVIIDTLHPLISLSKNPKSTIPLAALLTSFTSPTTALVAVFHADIPLPPPTSTANSYSPSIPTLLRYLATTLITVHALSHTLATHRAAQRSLPPPSFGLDEGVEGIIVGLGANGGELGIKQATEGLEVPPGSTDGIVLELEHRRKSGRGVSETYFLPTPRAKLENRTADTGSRTDSTHLSPAKAILLDDHPLFAMPKDEYGDEEDPTKQATTFSLGLTEQQRRDREGVVLPYFDAQKGGDGPGEGGRILYQMGFEDAGDYDSEEDEI